MQNKNEELLFDSVQEREVQLASVVANQISQMIIDNHLTTGGRLPNEFKLAERLNVGRGTVREAVKLLVAKNVLVIQRGKGTFVAKEPGIVDDPLGFAYIQNKFKLVLDLLEVRMTLEPWVAELAAQNATPEDIEIITRRCDEVEQLIRKGQPHIEADIKFHTSIAKCTKNLVVPNLIPVINSSINLFIEFTKSTLADETIETHRKLVEAIAAKNPQRAKESMIMHLIYNKERLSTINQLTPAARE